MSHVYRSHAADQGRRNGWDSFTTIKNKDGTWDCMQLPGGEVVGKATADFAFANNEWCAWGEVGSAPLSADKDPEIVGALVVKCKLEQLKNHGDVLVDRAVAKVWLRPKNSDGTIYLVMPMDSERWSTFGAGPFPDRYVPPQPSAGPAAGGGQVPARAARSAASGTAPIRQRSTADSPTKKVWAVADGMPGASRAEVVAACVELGINKSTAGTQYYHWKTAGGAERKRE